MLEKLTIRNFQKHKRKEIELGQITVFVGRTHAGKSSILRALKWVMLNHLTGIEFITHGEEKSSVKLDLKSSSVCRIRGKSNSYKLNQKTFKAIRSEVPPEIANLLQVTELNFQNQLDPPFWFTLSPGQVSRELNRIVNLDAIDSTQGNISSELRKARIAVEISEDRLREARQTRDSLKWVPDMCSELQGLKDREDDLSRKRTECVRIESLIQTGERLSKQRKHAQSAITQGKPILRMGERIRKCQGIIDRLGNCIKNTERLTRIVNNPIPSLAPLGLHVSVVESGQERIDRLQELITQLETQGEQLCRIRNELKAARAELSKIPTCPTCGNPVIQSLQ